MHGCGSGFGLDGFWVWDGFGFNLWPQVQSSSPDRVLLREHVMDQFLYLVTFSAFQGAVRRRVG